MAETLDSTDFICLVSSSSEILLEFNYTPTNFFVLLQIVLLQFFKSIRIYSRFHGFLMSN